MPLDLAHIFAPSLHPLELVLRGSAMYWFIFVLFRFVLRRDTGSIGIADILLLVIVADAAQNAMAGPYESVFDGMLLVATLAGWNWLLDWAGFHFEVVRRLAEPAPVVLVRRGRLIRHNLRREFITVPELMARLRENGVDDLSKVKYARLEGNGEISVIQNDPGQANTPRAPSPPAGVS